MTNILIHKKKLQDCLFSYYLQLFISRQFWVNDNGGKTPTLVKSHCLWYIILTMSQRENIHLIDHDNQSLAENNRRSWQPIIGWKQQKFYDMLIIVLQQSKKIEKY